MVGAFLLRLWIDLYGVILIVCWTFFKVVLGGFIRVRSTWGAFARYMVTWHIFGCTILWYHRKCQWWCKKMHLILYILLVLYYTPVHIRRVRWYEKSTSLNKSSEYVQIWTFMYVWRFIIAWHPEIWGRG